MVSKSRTYSESDYALLLPAAPHLPYFMFILRSGVIMGKKKDLSKEVIASIISLYKVQTPAMDVAKIVGVSDSCASVDQTIL